MRLDYGLACVALCATTVSAVRTGSTVCNNVLCVTGIHDSQTKMDTYTMTGPLGKGIPGDEFGWMAIGFGQTMSNTPMVIAWPNSNGSITLSQREAPSNVMPTVNNAPARQALLLKERCYANSTATSITFTIPADANATDQTLAQNVIIYAYSSKNPRSSNGGAPIQMHDYSGTLQLDLATAWSTASQPINATGSDSSGSSIPPSSDADVTGTSSRKVLVAHAICGGLATLAFLPVGTLIPRIARGFSLDRWWFPAHGVINGVLGAVFTLVAFAIAKANFGGHSTPGSNHRPLGLAMFLLVLFQVALGVFVHWYKSPIYSLQTKSGRGPSNFLHMVFGTLIVIVGWATAWTGLAQEWAQWSGTGHISVGWKVVWGLVVAGTTLAYVYGLVVLLPKQKAMEREARLRHSGTGVLKTERPKARNEESEVEMRSAAHQGSDVGTSSRGHQDSNVEMSSKAALPTS